MLKALSFTPDCELERYGEYFFADFSADLSICSILLFIVDSSRASLASLNA